MAEAILNAQLAGRFRAFSAGSHAVDTVNPRAIELLERNHHRTSELRSKSWDKFAAPGNAEKIHRAFNDAFSVLSRRISLFMCLPIDKLSRLALTQEVLNIGREQPATV